MAFELAFVDSIASSPTTRLNLNDGTMLNTLVDGTEFGMPELDRAIASTLLTDGAVVPASAYGNRLISLVIEFVETDLDTVATRLQSLARELDRTTNILRYKAGTTAPVFFRTFRSSVGNMMWDAVTRRAYVTILAEPFALGLREDISSVVINNDPAAGSNGLYADFTAIKGDVEAPAKVVFSGLNGGVFADVILGTRRRGTPSSMPMIFQAESLTAGTDTSVPGTDATMSGSSNNYQRTTFATVADMTLRLSMSTNFPAASGVDMRGTYRLYAVARLAASATFAIQWEVGAASSPQAVTSDVFTFVMPAASHRSVLDLGQITFPLGADPVTDGYSGVEKSITGGSLYVNAARTAGTGNLDWDYFVLVPDDPARGDDWFSFSLFNLATSKDVVADGPRDVVYPQDTSASTIPIWYAIPSSGRIPLLTPNQLNRWVMLRPDRAGTDVNYGDVKTRTTTITVSYWPRYVFVRPVSS